MRCQICGKLYDRETDTLPAVCNQCLSKGFYTTQIVPKTRESYENDILCMEQAIKRMEDEIASNQRHISEIGQAIEATRREMNGVSSEEQTVPREGRKWEK
jgi:superfamily II helicase